MTDLPPEYLDSKTPPDVIVTDTAPRPITDPTLGEPLGTPLASAPALPASPVHRLVTVGDSLTHGVSSGAVFHTDLSWPAQAARALGVSGFSFPTYKGPLDGLPLNLESLVRQLQKKFGSGLDMAEKAMFPVWLQRLLDKNEDYWERGDGRNPPRTDMRYENLGIYGWDIRDALSYTDARAATRAAAKPHDSFFGAKPQHDNDIAAHSVLAPFGAAATQVGAASAHGNDGGIDALVVVLGANNALDAVVSKEVKWSGPGYDQLEEKGAYNVWRPTHFAAEYGALVGAIRDIPCRRVVLATVPHVTIAPIAKGVNPDHPGEKWQPGSRFFPYYTDPWIDEKEFKPTKHRHLTHQEARAIDSAIDQYNATIVDAVRHARREGRDWYVLDLCGLLDGLAYRRYEDDQEAAGKNDWVPAGLPKPIADLDSRFFLSDARGRRQGGLFGLDGIHPTSSGYGVIARRLVDVLSVGQPAVAMDFAALRASDTLNSQPPALVISTMKMIAPFATRFVSRH
jgi:hypothetical protein